MEGIGVVEFPDSMSQAQILEALNKGFLPPKAETTLSEEDRIQAGKRKLFEATEEVNRTKEALNQLSPEKPKNDTPFLNILDQAALGIAGGLTDVSTTINKLAALGARAVPGPLSFIGDPLSKYLDERAQRSREMGQMLNQEGRESPGSNVPRHVFRAVPTALQSITPWGVAGGAIVGAIQSFTSTLTDAEKAYQDKEAAKIQAQGIEPTFQVMEKIREDSKSKAYLPAIGSGLSTLLLTLAGGKTGVEALSEIVKGRSFSEGTKMFLKGILGEFAEEELDELAQGVISKFSYDPNKTWPQIFEEAAIAGGIGAVLGGGASVVGQVAAPSDIALPTPPASPIEGEPTPPAQEEGPIPGTEKPITPESVPPPAPLQNLDSLTVEKAADAGMVRSADAVVKVASEPVPPVKEVAKKWYEYPLQDKPESPPPEPPAPPKEQAAISGIPIKPENLIPGTRVMWTESLSGMKGKQVFFGEVKDGSRTKSGKVSVKYASSMDPQRGTMFAGSAVKPEELSALPKSVTPAQEQRLMELNNEITQLHEELQLSPIAAMGYAKRTYDKLQSKLVEYQTFLNEVFPSAPPTTTAVIGDRTTSPVIDATTTEETASSATATPLGLPTETQGVIATPGPPLTPSGTSTNPLPLKSQRQIITDLAKGLNIPIRFGRLTTGPNYGGYFKKVQNLIGSRSANNIPIVTHEGGHKLDDMFKLSADKTIAAELDVLGDPSTAGSMSSWTKSKSKKYKLGEGVAEFVRLWTTDPAQAAKAAPNTLAAFETVLNANKDVGDLMRMVREDVQRWRTAQPMERLLSQVSIGENPNKTRYSLSQLTRDLVDDLHFLKLAVNDAIKSIPGLKPSQNPYLLARNLRGSYGMAETFIRNGVVDFNTKEVEMGTSLEDALKPVAGRINDFRAWIVAKRAQELMGQNRETGLVKSDVDAVADKFERDAVFQKAFMDIKDWSDSFLKYAHDAGLLNAKSVAAMLDMNRDYVPFHRLFEIGAGESPAQSAGGLGSGLNVGKPGSLKGLKGSPRNIIDPLETLVKNAYALITASEKAAINRSIANLANMPDMGRWIEKVAAPKENVKLQVADIKGKLIAAGADLTNVDDETLISFFRQGTQAPFGENIIRVVNNGKPEFYRLNSELFKTFNALDMESSGMIIRMLSSPAQLLRAGVTLEPGFSLANALRDTFSAAVLSRYGTLPFQTTLNGLGALIGNPKLVAEWAASGGKSSIEAAFFDRDAMQKYLRDRITKDLTPAERATVILGSPLRALRLIATTFEEATRIGEYKLAFNALTKSGMPDGEARRLAAFEARDRQDFAKGGAQTKVLRHMAAFWNAGLQANVKLAQTFKERPVRTLLQGVSFVTIPKLLEQAMNWDDEDYWDRPQWERDAFFMIPRGKDEGGHTKFIRIPIPFEIGVIFGTLPGRILQYGKTKHPEDLANFPATMLKGAIPNPIPQTLQAVFENFLTGKQGWSVFRGRPIVPDSLADLPPEMQWTEQTSRAAKEIGKAFKISPLKIDNMIDQTAGGVGKVITGRTVPGKRFLTTPLVYSNQPVEDFYTILDALKKEAARAKGTDKPAPPEVAFLRFFEKTATVMSKHRKTSKTAETESARMEAKEAIFQRAKEAVQKFQQANP